MKAKIWIAAVSIVLMMACSKDKFTSTPKLTFESINATTFSAGQPMLIKLRLTDKEGDFLVDSSGYLKPYLFYQRVSFICPDLVDTAVSVYSVPAFPTRKYLDAFIDINYIYSVSDIPGQSTVLAGCPNGKDDSTYFKFWIKDEAGNISDTIKTPILKLIKN